MKTKTKPEKPNPDQEELKELLDRMYDSSRPFAPIRRLVLMLSYVAFGTNGTVSERSDRFAAAGAAVAANERLFAAHGVKLRTSYTVLLRVMELCNPPDGSYVSPVEVVRRHIEEPAERLIRRGKAGRGDTIAVRKHPLGNRLEVGLARRD